jgi:hypothetical protein
MPFPSSILVSENPLEINLDSTERSKKLLTIQNLCARNLNAFTVLEEASPL